MLVMNSANCYYSWNLSHVFRQTKMTRRFNLLLLILTITQYVSSEILRSNDCTVTDNDPSNVFSFRNLSMTDVEVHDERTNGTITIRLCSPLLTTCGGHNSYSICLRKDNEEVGIGKSPALLRNEDDALYFTFNGDKCESDKNYTVKIIMKCNYRAAGPTTPELFPREDKCTLNMLWNTNLACGPEKKTDCSVTDQFNNRFDLSPLTEYSTNHFVHLDKKGHSKMVINVCHTIIREHGAACLNEAGACLVNLSNPDAPIYTNHGQPGNLIIENNTLKIVYENGDLCQAGWHVTNKERYQTTISFICDPEATTDTEAKLANDSKPCDYTFIWKTALACNRTVLDQYREANANKCTVDTPDKKERYNFQNLMNVNQDFTATSSSNTQYKFRVCGPVVGSQCTAEGTGICDTKNSASAGTANSNLMWQHGGPYLNYTDGDTCGNGQKRYTVIAFFCGAEGSDESPIVVKDEECYLIIHWFTQDACKTRITCAQNQTNLEPLIRKSKNVVVTELGKEFHINVCNPLVPTPGLACPHGSAVCQAVQNTKGQYVNETSLGFADQSPVLDDDQNLILNYTGGSTCPENPKRDISSSFKFICNYTADLGQPRHKKYTNCHYEFEWETNIVCGAVVGKWFSPCTIKDSSHQYELDLSSLYDKQNPRYVTTKGKNYSISICGGKEHCNGSAVCQGTNGYGTFSHVTLDYSSKLIKLQYSNSTKCFNESYASELSLICNKTAGIGDPVLKLDSHCSVLFEWQTSVACPGVTRDIADNSLLTTEKISTDFTKESSVPRWIVSCAIILVVVVLGAWLFLRYPQRCAHLKSRISAITATENHSRIQYSRVNTTEEARLLLDPSDPCSTDGHIDSDDELLGV